MFSPVDELEAKYTADTVASVLRIRDMYLWLIKFPSTKDADFVKEDCNRYKVSRPTAYADLSLLKAILPNIAKSTKEFNAWRFMEMILETYNLAKFKKDVRTMERAAATLAKYAGLDKDEPVTIPVGDILVQPFIPSDDPSVLGFKPIPNLRQRVKELMEKYSRDVPEIIDIEAEEADLAVPDQI